jgi:acetylornithine/N-succinyldiaminopimelate aminotransferase
MTPHLMNAFPRTDLQAVRGEGCHLIDLDGKRYLDFLAGVAVNALGHCHPVLVEALCEQARTLWHASNLVRVPQQERLADRLCAASFADVAFFTNSGSEAVDFALKLVRRYFKTTATPGRWRTITFKDGFHGRSMAAIAAGGQAKLTQGYEPVVPGFDCVPFADLDAVKAAIGPETAAILLEPVQGDGGIRVFPFEFVAALRKLCDEHGLLLVLDEVQTGIGRTGRFFAYEWAGITPDIVACAKGLGAGFPLGAVLTTAAVGATITPGSHGTTLGGAPLASAVGNALLDVVLAEGFIANVEATGAQLRARLEAVVAKYPSILAEVRGVGLLIGLKCVVPNKDMMAALRANAMLVGPGGDNIVRLLPPLIIGDAEIDEAITAIEAACRDLSAAGTKNRTAA